MGLGLIRKGCPIAPNSSDCFEDGKKKLRTCNRGFALIVSVPAGPHRTSQPFLVLSIERSHSEQPYIFVGQHPSYDARAKKQSPLAPKTSPAQAVLVWMGGACADDHVTQRNGTTEEPGEI